MFAAMHDNSLVNYSPMDLTALKNFQVHVNRKQHWNTTRTTRLNAQFAGGCAAVSKYLYRGNTLSTQLYPPNRPPKSISISLSKGFSDFAFRILFFEFHFSNLLFRILFFEYHFSKFRFSNFVFRISFFEFRF